MVELLVVVVIIAVLAAVGFPLATRMRESSRAVTCTSNLRQVGTAILMYATDHQNKLPPSPADDPATGNSGDIWPMVVAWAGYLCDNPRVGPPPCGKGVWTCPSSDFMSNAYGGYGVVENHIFVRESGFVTNGMSKEAGSLRTTRISRPENTWLVGDAAQSNKDLKKGWYAIWPTPGEWANSHCPAPRHGNKANVCMFDGHVESLSLAELEQRKITVVEQ